MDVVGKKDEAPQQSFAKPSGTMLLLIVLFSIDDLNPVRFACSYTFGLITKRQVGSVAALLLFGVCIHQRRQLLYFVGRLFFRCTLNNMFFRSVEVVGAHNLPATGPVILTGNHNNQFVDGLILLTNCEREISFMIAQKSYDRPFVGFLARAFNCIPVSRPQDVAVKGNGLVFPDGTTRLRGEGTQFLTQVDAGAQLVLKGHDPIKIKSIASNTEVELSAEVPALADGSGMSYKVLPKVDQSKMYDAVYKSLTQGKCLGIFPEGGSHDRTDLLPLKAGVAIIALGATAKYHINIPIVPVGLTYFDGHRFGGRVVVEFGSPIDIPEPICAQYETDKHAAVDALLQMVTNGMRGVIVPTPDYHTLQLIYMARRLFAQDGLKLSTEQSMDLSRRFAAGLDRIMQLVHDAPVRSENDSGIVSPGEVASGAKLSAEDIKCIEDLRADLEKYRATLKSLGLRDHHVRSIGWWSTADLVGRVLYLVGTMALGAIPQVLFNVPAMAIARALAVTEQKKAVQASSVKLKGLDVVMSYKVLYCLMFSPVVYTIYTVVLFTCTSYSTTTIVLLLFALPVFSYLGTMASEQGFRTYHDVVPLLRRLNPQNRAQQDEIPALRASLQKRLRQAVRKYGPLCEDIYYGKKVDWNKEFCQEVSPGKGKSE